MRLRNTFSVFQRSKRHFSKYPKPIEEDDRIYTPEKDPMRNLSEEQVKEIKERIKREGEQMYSIGFAIIGGGFGALLLSYFLLGSPNKKR